MAKTRLSSVKPATPSIKVCFIVKQPACAAAITMPEWIKNSQLNRYLKL
ncbi:MAG TPA: hypothetical protein VIP70_01645 [Nitrososphaeraceae archaeon]